MTLLENSQFSINSENKKTVLLSYFSHSLFTCIFPIILDMENTGNFTTKIIPLLDEKAKWYDTEELPRLLEGYRLLHACVKTLFDFLVKKSLITPDPYKLDKKINDIKAPESKQFVETERSVVMGQRFSDYESMLDFLSNYYKFSTAHLNLTNIKKLMDLNNSFHWANFTINNSKTNTRVLANIVAEGRQSSDTLTSSMIGDSLSKATKAMNDITAILKDYTEFRKEFYKGQIRRNVFTQSGFSAEKAFSSPSEEMAQIKKNFAAGMGKATFISELIDEIIQEDQGEKKEEAQNKALSKMTINSKKQKAKQEEKVDTKAILIDAILTLGGLPSVLQAILEKVKANHDIHESSNMTFFDKFKRALRKAFNLEEPPLYYPIIIVEHGTGAKKHEKINYNQFIADIATKAKRYTIFTQKKSQGYAKITSMEENKLFDFLSAQITDCNRLLVLLNSLDDFFKAATKAQDRSRIKGLKIDITNMKNIVVKTNQRRSDYASYVEEREQMKRLGISI